MIVLKHSHSRCEAMKTIKAISKRTGLPTEGVNNDINSIK